MQEDLKKKFILLSKFAKEKKYAQEYLGLLARRGDLGSIRIGKRWYTSREWFSEFLADAKKRKEEVAVSLLENNAVKISNPILEVKKEMILKPEFFAEKKKDITIAGNAKEYFSEDDPSSETALEIKVKIPETVKRREISSERISVRPMDFAPRQRPTASALLSVNRSRDAQTGFSPVKEFSRGVDFKSQIKINRPERQIGKPAPKFSDIKTSYEKKIERHWEVNKNEKLAPEKFLEIKRSDSVFSPSFAQRKRLSNLFSPKLAFGLVSVLLFFLIFAAFSFTGDLARLAGFDQTQGTVAGASNENGSGLTNFKSEADYYLSSSADAMKESVSFSRLMVRTALERNNGQ